MGCMLAQKGNEGMKAIYYLNKRMTGYELQLFTFRENMLGLGVVHSLPKTLHVSLSIHPRFLNGSTQIPFWKANPD